MELVRLIAMQSSDGTLFSLVRASKLFQKVAEPILYQKAAIVLGPNRIDSIQKGQLHISFLLESPRIITYVRSLDIFGDIMSEPDDRLYLLLPQLTNLCHLRLRGHIEQYNVGQLQEALQ